jgi:aminoglycoside phosphotransferase (APT) family kinase protein
MFVTDKTSIDEIRALLRHAGIEAARSLQKCPSGANSITFEIDGRFIARFPKNQDVLDKLTRETRVLDFLHGKTSLAIPRVTYFEGEYPFSLHTKILGGFLREEDYSSLTEGDKNIFAEQIAEFLSQLHGIPLAEVAPLALPVWNRFDAFPGSDVILDVLAQDTALTPEEKDFLRAFCVRYFSAPAEASDVVFGHCDIMPKNLAYDYRRRRINGIYDFGDSGLVRYAFEFNQMALDWPFDAMRRVAVLYDALTGRQTGMARIADHALFNRLCFYIESIRFKQSGDYLDKLRIMMQRYRPANE